VEPFASIAINVIHHRQQCASRQFGSVAVQPKDSYVRGRDTASASFRSANPRHNQRIEGSFLTIDLLSDDGNWETRYVDGDWCTRFFWNGGDIDSYGVSFAEISWDIPDDAEQGIYRICNFGTRKTMIANVEWMLAHAPGWWLLDAFGSMFVGITIEVIRTVAYFYEPLSDFLSNLSFPREAEFSRCSKSFLVRTG